jgi:adenylate cyclase
LKRASILAAALRRRERLAPAAREKLDVRTHAKLDRKLAIVYTDTDDFTLTVARHGMMHFLMMFARAVRTLRPIVARHGGRLVKIEADSLLLVFKDAGHACRAVIEMEAALERLNRREPESERVVFSFGIGYGQILDLGDDVLGLEVNLASKLGEDRAVPGEVLVTEAAVAALPPALRARLDSCGHVDFTGRPTAIARLRVPPHR